MNRNEERRDLSKKVLTALLSADDGSPVSDMPTFQKNLAKLCVGYADALLDELEKVENPKETDWAKHFCQSKVMTPTYLEQPVATGDVQVGDLVMWQFFGECVWNGPCLLKQLKNDDCKKVGTVPGILNWVRVRHLTDEERAQIKRI